MTKLTKTFGALALSVLTLSPTIASAQQARVPSGQDPVVEGGMNNTGGDRIVRIPRDATGAGTITTESAAGGNANQPARPLSQGGAGGASGGQN